MHTLIKPLQELRELMLQHRSSDIAKASGVHVNTVRAIRNGVNLNPTIGVLTRISEALDSMETAQ